MDRNAETRYLKAKRPTSAFNAAVATLTKLGVSVWGTRLLYVRGRKTGQWRATPVNLLTIDGERYLVAPRGHTQWVRNLRMAGEGRLSIGRRHEDFTAAELRDEEKAPVMRAYLKKWGWEVGAFFENLKADSPDQDFAAAAPGFPVFRIQPGTGS